MNPNNKSQYSSSISNALIGRIEELPAESTPSVQDTNTKDKNAPAAKKTPKKQSIASTKKDKKGNVDKGFGFNQDGTYRQSPAGRHTVANKKVQIALTLTPSTKERLEEWASAKPRSATNYLSEYIEENIDEIIKYYSK